MCTLDLWAIHFTSYSYLTTDVHFFIFLKLQSGKQCLCRYVLPCELERSAMFNNGLTIHSISSNNDLKITGVADSVQGRFNVILDNGQVCYLS